ncbi:hypothetical protein EON65_22655 [archaeon]|nr:MAG: hypothetical protein EON65_22655 [archaeon]
MTIRDTILSAASPTIFIILLLSFVKSASDLLEDNNRRGISIVPYLTLTANCAIWTLYSILRHDTPVFIANFVGLCTGSICTALYHFYSIHRPSAWQYAVTVAILLVGLYLAYSRAVLAEGTLAMCLAVCIYGAPLVTLSKVIQERSTQSMPFLISLGKLVCAYCSPFPTT